MKRNWCVTSNALKTKIFRWRTVWSRLDHAPWNSTLPANWCPSHGRNGQISTLLRQKRRQRAIAKCLKSSSALCVRLRDLPVCRSSQTAGRRGNTPDWWWYVIIISAAVTDTGIFRSYQAAPMAPIPRVRWWQVWTWWWCNAIIRAISTWKICAKKRKNTPTTFPAWWWRIHLPTACMKNRSSKSTK